MTPQICNHADSHMTCPKQMMKSSELTGDSPTLERAFVCVIFKTVGVPGVQLQCSSCIVFFIKSKQIFNAQIRGKSL